MWNTWILPRVYGCFQIFSTNRLLSGLYWPGFQNMLFYNSANQWMVNRHILSVCTCIFASVHFCLSYNSSTLLISNRTDNHRFLRFGLSALGLNLIPGYNSWPIRDWFTKLHKLVYHIETKFAYKNEKLASSFY